MNFKINQKYIVKFRFLVLPIFIVVLFACAFVPTKTYEETVFEWKSYKDLAKWMNWHFTYDMRRREAGFPIPVRTPEETFELKSGVCFDAARFAKETLNRIDPSYEAEIVYIHRIWYIQRENNFHFVCSFKKDGKLYIIDYGTTDRSLIGVHGPYNSLEEYKKFIEWNGPPGLKVLSVTFGWPHFLERFVK
jgi:hypothetical protein